MISSSPPGAGTVVVEHKKKSSLCSVNTEFQDAGIPDLNIAHVPCSSDEDAAVERPQGCGDGTVSHERSGQGLEDTSVARLENHGHSRENQQRDGQKQQGDGQRLENQQEDDARMAGGSHQQEQELQRSAVAVTVSELPAPSWLPEGWISECRTRGDGHKDKYYIESYSGRRFRSKVEVFKYLETGVPPARWKRKGKAIDAAVAGLNDKLVRDASRSLELQRETLGGGMFTSAAGADFLVSSVSASDTFKTSHATFDGLRGAPINGIAPPASFLQRGSMDAEQPSKKPVFFDYWTSTLGSGGASAAASRSSSWTENYKVGSNFVNGMPSSVPCFGSKASSESTTTPHWLDRILNKPPPAAIAQPGYSFGLTGGFVQSPLHYLQNAGAFQNNWLNLKPPTAITQSDYDVPWKSRSWFDARETDRLERRVSINLNHPVVDPEEELRGRYQPVDHRHRQEFSSRTTAPSSLESLWKKAVPITLEHREYVAYSNGSSGGGGGGGGGARSSKGGGNQHSFHQHNPAAAQYQKSELGVKRGGQKMDRYQEKKRLERLGIRLCEQGLARLVHELKDRGRGIELN